MHRSNKTAYVDFSVDVDGVSTAIRIFETEKQVFIYVNQNPLEMHLYNDMLKDLIVRGCSGMKKKEFTVLCNLAKHDSLENVAKTVLEVLNE
ncbi:hypothetical protein ENBRE01_1654 [Enteropsectra breve]|nr:hypothetical protein ENBRE01_1654 [Enteropsectra breve]